MLNPLTFTWSLTQALPLLTMLMPALSNYKSLQSDFGDRYCE